VSFCSPDEGGMHSVVFFLTVFGAVDCEVYGRSHQETASRYLHCSPCSALVDQAGRGLL